MQEPIREHHLDNKKDKIDFILQHTYDDASDSAKYSKDELNKKSDDEIDKLYHKVEKDLGMVETTGAASSGAFVAPLGYEKKKFVEGEEQEEPLDETTTSSSSGQYSQPGVWAKKGTKPRFANKPAWKGGEIIGEGQIIETSTKHINVQDPSQDIGTFGRAKIGKTTTKNINISPTHHGAKGKIGHSKINYGKGFASPGHTLTKHGGFSHNAKGSSKHAYHTHHAWGNKGTHKNMKKLGEKDMKQNSQTSSVWAGGQIIGDNYLIDPKGFRNFITEIDKNFKKLPLFEAINEDNLTSFDNKLNYVVDAFNKAGIPVNADELRNNEEAINRLYDAIQNGMFAGMTEGAFYGKNKSDVDDSLIPFMAESLMTEGMTPEQAKAVEDQILQRALSDLQNGIEGLKQQGGQPSPEALNNISILQNELRNRGVLKTSQPVKPNFMQKVGNMFKSQTGGQQPGQQPTQPTESDEINANPMNEENDSEREKKINDIIELETAQYGKINPQAEEYMRKLLQHMNDVILNNFYMTYKKNTNETENLDEKSKSVAQQQFMGMVHAAQKGELKNPSPAVEKAANSMSDKDAKDFASTKHEGLPQHVKKESIIDQPPLDDRDQTTMKLKQDVTPTSTGSMSTGISSIGGVGENIDEDVRERTHCNKNQEPVAGVPINKEGGCKEKITQQEKMEREKNPHNIEFRKKRIAKYQKELANKKSEYQKELEQNKKNMEKSKKKVTNEDRKPSAIVLLDRLKKDNEANFDADLKKSNIKDAIDTENELKAKDQAQEVGENPYELGEELENNDIKRTKEMALKNAGDSTNDKGDEIPKRNLTKEEENDVKMLRGQQSDWVFDNKPAKRFEERMEKDMGPEIYKQRQDKMKFKADAPMFNKDTIPTGKEHANDTQFNKYKTGWNERDGLKEAMLTGKYKDEFGNVKFINFKLTEAKEVEKVENNFSLLNLEAMGNSYTTKVHENKEMRNIMNAFNFYLNGNKIVKVKNGKQTLSESEEKQKPIVNEQFESMKKLMNYDPSKYVNTDNIKKIIRF